jgi:hypothetical protein
VTSPSPSELLCPLCNESSFVRRLLFFTYCANPAHTHKKGEQPVNTILEFRQCVEHGVRDACVAALLHPAADEPALLASETQLEA